MSSRTARSLLYRDFYDLFSSGAARPIVRRTPRCLGLASTRSISRSAYRPLQVVSQDTQNPEVYNVSHIAPHRKLPLSCPGCGAPTQNVHREEPGYYSEDRRAVKNFLNPTPRKLRDVEVAEDELLARSLANVPEELRQQLGLDALQREEGNDIQSTQDEVTTPICDRCHSLMHHHKGTSISHPSLDAIAATIAESDHKHNHVYHVIDAADFPMSVVPGLLRKIDFGWIRGRNRRAKTQNWSSGKSGELSFIITRSDLLAPKKEQVDALLPQLREILRDALGRAGEDKRLGDVRLVSSTRGWWTKDVKSAIAKRGGANWLVGKANVGKSHVFEVVYPKGLNEPEPNFDRAREEARKKDALNAAIASPKDESLMGDDGGGIGTYSVSATETEAIEDIEDTSNPFDTRTLLPPPQPEVQYPVMPIASALPGTTASPIRIPFAKGRGELIDLPGLERRTLEPYVKPEHQLDVVMKKRVAPERFVLKPGQSLVLGGGLIRITPTTPDLIYMVHAFVPMSAHVTSSTKAQELQQGERDINIPSIMNDEKKGVTKSAGMFLLKSDVTKQYAGPLTRGSDVGLSVSRLPFIVWSTDILVEGCGWIEVVAQVRKPRRNTTSVSEQEEKDFGDFRPLHELPEEEIQDAAAWSPMTTGEHHDNPSRDLNTFTPVQERQASQSTSSFKAFAEEKRGTQVLRDLTPFQLANTRPTIEVFSPEGKFIGQRPSLSCWLLGGPLPKKKTARMGRPMKSMKGAKKAEKRRKREAASF